MSFQAVVTLYNLPWPLPALPTVVRDTEIICPDVVPVPVQLERLITNFSFSSSTVAYRLVVSMCIFDQRIEQLTETFDCAV